MKRDFDLIRKILLAIEEQYVDVALYNIKIDDYDKKVVAYHCDLLYDAGLISNYKAQYANGTIHLFGVGSLTWEGHEFLDKIKSDTIWNKTKETVIHKGLPWAFDVVKDVVSAVTAGIVQGALKSGV